ncbi:trigger factor [Niallia circulans]|jgi:trigger factor|uniref:Trigger factor n=1 Tax=Niallia circulans TaxID=1397 RepID=A0A0J1L6F1_NIACI|nr:trigger factor [Niallia circulans]AYV67373.1 trigger factor [Niallia circulans]AYV74355.1 trigger factor [Niallia circulans]KLV24480.1 trigger factor [Niallia circulans]MCM2980541.1 trigger factor [Niallia circulans]MDR4317371.1 trigger factor [Niallia circulans]
MSAKWEVLEGNRGVLTIELDAEKLNEGLDLAFKKVVKQVNIPGFRKGRIPRGMFEQRFGVESLYQDAIDILLPEAYANAIDETGIEPVDRPEIDVEQIEKGKSLIFKATVTVKPEVTLGEYKGLEVPAVETTVTDEEVEAEIKALQEKQAELVVKEEGTAELGDTVVIDFEGFQDGVAFEGGTAENFSLELGSGQFIPGFEEKLVGVATGESTEVEVTFPEEYHAEDLAGKPATFKVTVHEIKGKELPELDDEFAKDVDEEAETLAELKEKIKTRLENDKKHQAEHTVRDTVVEKASENAKMDIPSAMIDTEIDRMMSEFEQRLQMQGMNLELYFQFSGQDEAALKDQMKEDAEKRVRSNLTLEAIVAAENIEVTEEEVNAELENMSQMYNMPVDAIKQALGGVENLQMDIKMRKAIDFLVENSKTVA